MRLIVERAELSERDVVLEVGTGTGALTGMMAARAGSVVTVEIDATLLQLASEELFGIPNVVLLQQDSLKNKSTFDPGVLAALEAQLAVAPERQLKLVANLPYSVATPVIANLLTTPMVPRSMTVTIQKEVAERIVARPGTKDYGVLSVWMQSQCRVEMVRSLPPTVFWPRPKVTSAIIHVEVDDDALRELWIGRFSTILFGAIFSSTEILAERVARRLKGRLDKAGVNELLLQTGLSAECRADQLELEAILKLSEAARARLNGVEFSA